MNRISDRLNHDKASHRDPALACFLNSLARENQSVQIELQNDGYFFKLPLSDGGTIEIRLCYYSEVGGHDYYLPAHLITEDNVTLLSAQQIIEHVASEPLFVGHISNEQKAIFVKRVYESHYNTTQAIENSPYQTQLFTDELDFKTAEQGLLIGHSFHPAPKSREQFTPQDAKSYSPELGGQFQLHWLEVSQQRLVTGSSANVPFDQRIKQLVIHDSTLKQALDNASLEGKTLLPVHPWQWQVMQDDPSIEHYIKSREIVSLGQIGAIWYPTSSTRSLYAPTLPYMLKFSLSVKLTNSIRNLSLKEVIRGTRLNDLFQQQTLANELGDGFGFQLMQEPAYMGLKDKNNQIIDASLVAFRDNPLAEKPQQEAVVLATLTQQNPYAESSLVAHRIRHYAKENNLSDIDAAQRWFDAYCTHTVVPLFHLQANFGIVFLAHQQNIVMQLEQGFPVGMYYRDCQGTGYTDLAFQLFSHELGDDKQALENYWNFDKVKRYFAYYLIINSTFNVISAISSSLSITESQLVKQLHAKLNALLNSGVKDDRCLKYVLSSDALCCKGNFYCYLANFNENSIPDPAVIYFDLPNPLINIRETVHE